MRTELWEAKAAVFAQFSGSGLTIADVARRTDTSYPTVKRYAERFGFDFSPQEPRTRSVSVEARSFQDAIAAKLRILAEEGKSRKEAAEEVGLSYQDVIRYGLRYGLPFIHASVDPKAVDRAKVMAAMYRGGKTLDEIGKLYGVTRERVRQLIKKNCGLTGADGGQSAIAQRKREAAQAKRDARSLERHGCRHDQYLELVKMRGPTIAWTRQKNNALKRDVCWNLKLWDWWQIWQESGKWEQRGRGKGRYVMCRFGDTGAYEPGNVYIATCEHNVSFQPNNPYRLGHPDHEKAVAARRERGRSRPAVSHKRKYHDLPIGVTKSRNRFLAQIGVNGRSKYLGTFGTVEEAHAAYLRAATANDTKAKQQVSA
jgi:transposase